MGRLIDLEGKTFGKLTVIERSQDNILPSGLNEPMWLCVCECGMKTTVRGAFLRTGHTTSCGCHGKTVNYNDLTGTVSNGITVLRRIPDTLPIEWECRCVCGNTFVTRGSSIRNGHTKSCGCRKKQLRIADMLGQKFDKLTVIERGDDEITSRGNTRHIRWECLCECGRMTLVRGTALRARTTRSCGCARFENPIPASNGEIWISEYLSKHGYTFIGQKTYPTLIGVGGGLLSFDFAVKHKHGTLLIECQGLQHYQPIEYFGGIPMFERQVEHDKRKRNYVKSRKDLDLIEIPYLLGTPHDDLIDLLTQKLSKYSI